VLIDGRRLAPGGIGGSAAADLNFIPSALISNIQILTGGASSTYGADAVAGVVNFVMNRKFEGVRVDVNYNFFQHGNGSNNTKFVNTNNDSDLRSVINKRFNTPNGSTVDGGSLDGNLVFGAALGDGRGHVTAYAGFRQDQAITEDSRDYSTCTLNPDPNPAVTGVSGKTLACGGSGTPALTRFGNLVDPSKVRTQATDPDTMALLFDPDTGLPVLKPVAVLGSRSITTGNTLRPFVTSDQFNFAPLNYYRRPSTRYSLGAFADYEINEHFTPYMDVMFMDYSTKAQIAPSGAFFGPRSVNCDNPLLLASPAIASAVCVVAGKTLGAATTSVLNTPTKVTVNIGKRNVEGGGRFNDIGFNQFRIVAGLKGDISDAWSYDVYAQFGQVGFASVYRNDVSDTRIDRALNVVNVGGVPTCQSVVDGTDPSCVPYNVFALGGVTQAAVNYISIPLVLTGKTRETLVSGYFSGDLGKMGLKSPFAESGPQLVLGAEYRKEDLATQPDLSYINGDGAGQGGPTLPIIGQYDVKDFFTELSLPLVQEKPFFNSLQVDLGYRYSTYNNGSKKTNASTYKIELGWSPIEDVKFRGSINRAVRAANIGELFANRSIGLFNGSDPCAGTAPEATAAQCANTGLAPSRYGTIESNSAGQYNSLSGGNLSLKPEKADTWTLGVVLQPKNFLPNFSLTVDYFNIKIADAINTVGAQVILDQCVATGNPFVCGKIKRSNAAGAEGSLWLDSSGFIEDDTTNTGSVKTSGIDVAMNYKLDIGDTSSVGFKLDGTYLNKYITQPITNGFDYDCAGFYGLTCLTPSPKWRHSFRVKFNPAWPVNIAVTWRYVGGVKLDRTSADKDLSNKVIPAPSDAKIGSQNYFDLAVGVPVSDKLNFRIGVRNILDRDPPIISQGSLPATIGNGNTIVGTYDYLGRNMFMNLTADF
jgi:iron complex outermembrane recepter protein